jgi:hypothetical protein
MMASPKPKRLRCGNVNVNYATRCTSALIRDILTIRGYAIPTMKMISLVAICVGALFLIVALVEGALKVYPYGIHPFGIIALSQTFFLLAVALMCYCRFYGSTNEQKKN